MNETEKKTLRRKRQNALEHIEVNNNLLEEFKELSLIDEETVESIKAEKNNGSKVNKLLDALLGSSQSGAFDAICEVLVRHQPWLGKELQMDIRLERGDLEIDEEVARSAATLVHRKFGTSKRFSEVDKKEITDLIAIKLQVSKEEWMKEMSELQEKYDLEVSLNKIRDKQARAVEAMVVRFLKENKEDLTTHAHDMETTSDILNYSVSDKDVLEKLSQKMRFLIGKMEIVVKQTGLLKTERDKCLKELEVHDMQTKLNEVIASKMATLPTKVEKLERDIREKDISLRRLRSIIDEIEKELEEKSENLRLAEEEKSELKSQLLAYQEKVRYLEYQNSRIIATSNVEPPHISPTRRRPRRATTAYQSKR